MTGGLGFDTNQEVDEKREASRMSAAGGPTAGSRPSPPSWPKGPRKPVLGFKDFASSTRNDPRRFVAHTAACVRLLTLILWSRALTWVFTVASEILSSRAMCL